MDLLSSLINAAVLSAVMLLVGRLLKGRIEDLRREVDRRFEGVDRRLDDFRGEVNRRFEENDRAHEAIVHRIERSEDKLGGRIDLLQAAVGEMRADLTRVALAVGVRPEAEAGGH